MEEVFINLIKADLMPYQNITANMLEHTIQHWANKPGFVTKPIEYWYVVCSNANIKFNA